MDTAFGRNFEAPYQFHLSVGCQIEERAFGIQRGDDRGVWQGLEGIVKVDSGQRGREASKLPPHAFGIDDE